MSRNVHSIDFSGKSYLFAPPSSYKFPLNKWITRQNLIPPCYRHRPAAACSHRTSDMSILELSTAKVKNIAHSGTAPYKLLPSTHLPKHSTPLTFTTKALTQPQHDAVPPAIIGRYDQYYDTTAAATMRTIPTRSPHKPRLTVHQLPRHTATHESSVHSRSSRATSSTFDSRTRSSPVQPHRLSVASIKLPLKIYDTTNPIFSSKLSRRDSLNEAKAAATTSPSPPLIPPLKIPSVNEPAPDQCSVINFCFPIPDCVQEPVSLMSTERSTLQSSAGLHPHTARTRHCSKTSSLKSSVHRYPKSNSCRTSLTPANATINYLPSLVDVATYRQHHLVTLPKSLSAKSFTAKCGHTTRTSLSQLSPSTRPQNTAGTMQVVVSPKNVTLSTIDNSINRSNKAFITGHPPLTSRYNKPQCTSRIQRQQHVSETRLCTAVGDGHHFNGLSSQGEQGQPLPAASSIHTEKVKSSPVKTISGLDLETNANQQSKSTSKDSPFPCSFSVRKKMLVISSTGQVSYGMPQPLSERMMRSSDNNMAAADCGSYNPLTLLSSIGWSMRDDAEQLTKPHQADYVVSKWKQIRPPPLTTRLLHNPGAAGIDSTSSPRPALYNSNHSNIMIEGNTNPDPHHSTTTNQQPKYKFKNCFKFQTFKPDELSAVDEYWKKHKSNKQNVLKVSSARIFEKDVPDLRECIKDQPAEAPFVKSSRDNHSTSLFTKQSKRDILSYANMTNISPSLKKKIMQLHGHQCGTIRKEKKTHKKIGTTKSYKPKVVISC